MVNITTDLSGGPTEDESYRPHNPYNLKVLQWKRNEWAS